MGSCAHGRGCTAHDSCDQQQMTLSYSPSMAADDGISLGPQEVYNYLCRVMYNRRNKFDPLWNSFIIAGIEPATHDITDSSSSSFLGMVGMIGTHYVDSHVTTGFANHLARPLFREKQSDDMSEEAAVELMHEALRVCYYRSALLSEWFLKPW